MSLKTVKKLGEKKYRAETGLFLVEGEKNIKELLGSTFIIEAMYGTTPFLDSVLGDINAYDERMQSRIPLIEVKQDDLEYAGTLASNNAGIAIVKQREPLPLESFVSASTDNFVLILDDIRDPGNLGTIIRIADWFGVTHIIASETTTDVYNPKVISATMGSFTRINIHYAELNLLLSSIQKRGVPVIAADMQSTSTHETRLPKNGFLIMGSESHGVHESLLEYVTLRVTIPRFGNAESLNVSVATGILLDSLRRG